MRLRQELLAGLVCTGFDRIELPGRRWFTLPRIWCCQPMSRRPFTYRNKCGNFAALSVPRAAFKPPTPCSWVTRLRNDARIGRHFFNTSFMYEAAGTPEYGLLIAVHPNVKSEDRQLIATAHYAVFKLRRHFSIKGRFRGPLGSGIWRV